MPPLNLKERAEKTAREIQKIIASSTDETSEKVAASIEAAIINALVEERQRCASVAFHCCSEDQDKAHKVAEEIRLVKSLLITNLSSMR